MGEPSTKPEDGGPAFPSIRAMERARDGSMTITEKEPGMSLRDWFAGQALAGFLATMANPKAVDAVYDEAAQMGRSFNQQLATDAYARADAMLAARKAGR